MTSTVDQIKEDVDGRQDQHVPIPDAYRSRQGGPIA